MRSFGAERGTSGGSLDVYKRQLEDFKAVQEGNVFCTTNDYYQQSMSVGDLMKDFHIMLLRGDDTQMKYLFRLK